jgi:general secretion pathway protein G
MARRRRQSEQTIYFPWERGGGFWRGRGLARARPIMVALGMAAVLLAFGARERRLTGIRSTRATLSVVGPAVDAYRADHDGECPPALVALKTEGYLSTDPVDAWGNPLRLTCPARHDPATYELMSDGPDGIIGGLDRVE